jgi:hypothetical protein
MFTVAPFELLAVREALREDSLNFGVGLLHEPSGRIGLRSFNDIYHRGGHLGFAGECAWRVDECLGFLVAMPKESCTIVNLSQLNVRKGGLHMPAEIFRSIVLSLRQCWCDTAANERTG